MCERGKSEEGGGCCGEYEPDTGENVGLGVLLGEGCTRANVDPRGMAGKDNTGANVVLGTMLTDVLFGKYPDINGFGDLINNGGFVFLYTIVSQLDTGRRAVFPLLSNAQDTSERSLSSPLEDTYNGITPMFFVVIGTPDREGVGYTGRKSAGCIDVPVEENNSSDVVREGSIMNCPGNPNKGVYIYRPRVLTNRAKPVMFLSEFTPHLLTGEKT